MSLRSEEAMSIRNFVRRAGRDGFLTGRVLDYGCGEQPYRDVVERYGGRYVGYDLASYPGNVSGEDVGSLEEEEASFTTILCNQVLQYVPPEDLYGELFDFWRFLLMPAGHIVITYATNWPEVESDDLHRFTKAGMDRLLTKAGFEIVRHDWRHGFQHEGVSFTAGYGVIARA